MTGLFFGMLGLNKRTDVWSSFAQNLKTITKTMKRHVDMRLGHGFGASWSAMGLSARPVGLGGPVWEPVWEADLSERLTCLGG